MRRAEIAITTSPGPIRSGMLKTSWREDNRRQSNGEQANRLAGLALRPSRQLISAGMAAAYLVKSLFESFDVVRVMLIGSRNVLSTAHIFNPRLNLIVEANHYSSK